MKDVKRTIIGAVTIAIVVVSISLLITYLGYNSFFSYSNTQPSKNSQDLAQALNELANKRHNILAKSIIDMSVGGKEEFEEAGNDIEEITKKLNSERLNSEDKELVEKIIDLNNEYNKKYPKSFFSDIDSFDNKSIAEISKSAQTEYAGIQKIQKEIKMDLAKSLETRISAFEEIDKRNKQIYSELSEMDSINVKIKNDLATLLRWARGEVIFYTGQYEEISNNLSNNVSLNSSMTTNLLSSLKDSQGSNTSGGADSIKKIISDFDIFQKISDMVIYTEENNSALMYSASTNEDTSTSFDINNANINQILANLGKNEEYKQKIAPLAAKNSSYVSFAKEIYKRTAIMKKLDFKNTYNNMSQLHNDFVDTVSVLKGSLNNYVVKDPKSASSSKQKSMFLPLLFVIMFTIIIGMSIVYLLFKKTDDPIEFIAYVPTMAKRLITEPGKTVNSLKGKLNNKTKKPKDRYYRDSQDRYYATSRSETTVSKQVKNSTPSDRGNSKK